MSEPINRHLGRFCFQDYFWMFLTFRWEVTLYKINYYIYIYISLITFKLRYPLEDPSYVKLRNLHLQTPRPLALPGCLLLGPLTDLRCPSISLRLAPVRLRSSYCWCLRKFQGQPPLKPCKSWDIYGYFLPVPQLVTVAGFRMNHQPYPVLKKLQRFLQSRESNSLKNKIQLRYLVHAFPEFSKHMDAPPKGNESSWKKNMKKTS